MAQELKALDAPVGLSDHYKESRSLPSQTDTQIQAPHPLSPDTLATDLSNLHERPGYDAAPFLDVAHPSELYEMPPEEFRAATAALDSAARIDMCIGMCADMDADMCADIYVGSRHALMRARARVGALGGHTAEHMLAADVASMDSTAGGTPYCTP